MDQLWNIFREFKNQLEKFVNKDGSHIEMS